MPIDNEWSEVDGFVVKRWFHLLLLLGALLGLLGQEAAFANVVLVEKAGQTATVAEMDADCAEMMALSKQQPSPDKPCEGMTPECIAKMGCALPVAVLPSLTSGVSQVFRAVIPPQMPVVPLIGRQSGTEPEPPKNLG